MDGPPAQSLGVEPVDDKVLQGGPRDSNEKILTRGLLFRTTISAILIVYQTLMVFAQEMEDGQVTNRDTTMTFMTFVNCTLLYAVSPYTSCTIQIMIVACS